MKKKELNETRKKTVEELRKEVQVLLKKRLLAHADIMGGKEKNLKTGAHIKRDIAQIMSLVSEKQQIREGEKEAI